LRRINPEILSAAQVADIIKASMAMPKEKHNALLEQVIEALEGAEIKSSEKVPVIISGSLCEACDEYILETLEEVGGIVVDDDLYVGSRYFATEVDEEKQPVIALASAYVNMVSPCPTRHNPGKKLADYLVEMVYRSKAKGIINVVVKYCEAHYYSYLILRRSLREYNIPECLIEAEHDFFSSAQVKTRLQSFIESISRRTIKNE